MPFLPSRPRPARTRLAAAAAAAVLVAGCGSSAGDEVSRQDAPSEQSQAATIEHVHGLGVDPDTGMLYAGSHYGLFQVPEEGKPALVSPVQDFMGFTVAGADRFLASGHPGEGQDGPGSVGLIESTDGGQSWQPLSLGGEADFHSLEVVDDTVFALNAMTGAFMTSSDGREWETLATAPVVDFAVNPADTDQVVATSEQGPVRSQDGGASFRLVPDAPLLLLVDWADDGTLVGLAPDGGVHVSTDRGTTWRERGRLKGAPEALHAQDADRIYAAAAGMVWQSSDGGETFTERPSA